MGYVDKASQAHLGSTLHIGFVPFNDKVADITHADTAKHEITLAALGLPPNVVALIVGANRVAGTGYLETFPNEGTFQIRHSADHFNNNYLIGIINQRLQYRLTVANDDFDLYCKGYFIAGRVEG